MKALSLWQPWASLVAVEAKTIETRSWSTKYRGPLAIHAAKRPMKGDETALRLWWDNRDVLGCQATESAVVPYGAIVATCTLLDVVPMEREDAVDTDGAVLVLDTNDVLTLSWGRDYFGEAIENDVTAELPYGDYRPGRFAWVLTDIAPTAKPIPATGHQGLWNFDPSHFTSSKSPGQEDM